jgi:hypothetical protein
VNSVVGPIVVQWCVQYAICSYVLMYGVLCTVYCALCTVYCVLCTVHCPLANLMEESLNAKLLATKITKHFCQSWFNHYQQKLLMILIEYNLRDVDF